MHFTTACCGVVVLKVNTAAQPGLVLVQNLIQPNSVALCPMGSAALQTFRVQHEVDARASCEVFCHLEDFFAWHREGDDVVWSQAELDSFALGTCAIPSRMMSWCLP